MKDVRNWLIVGLASLVLYLGIKLTYRSKQVHDEVVPSKEKQVSVPSVRPQNRDTEPPTRSRSDAVSVVERTGTRPNAEPTQAAALAAQARRERTVQNGFGVFVDHLGLSSEKTRELRRLLVERAAIIEDSAQIAGNAGKAGDTAEFWELRANALLPLEQEITALLQWQDVAETRKFLKLGRTYNMADSMFFPRLAYADVPLDSEKKVLLATAMRDAGFSTEDPTYVRTAKELANPDTGWNSVYQKLVDRSQSFLSTAQIDVLRKVQIEHDAGLPTGLGKR